MADAARPGLGRAVVIPSGAMGAGLLVLALFFSQFLQDHRTLTIGILLSWIAFTAGRVLAHLDQPRGYGLVARYVLTGTTLGLVGSTMLRAIFLEGPGWPWTPWWVLLGGVGMGVYRSHRALLKQARENDGTTERWLKVFHPKDVQALVVLMSGYALVGISGFLVLRAFAGLIPGSGQILGVAIAAYAMHGARLLLKFAAEERGASGQGFVGWMRAHALQNAIVVLVLVAYAVFRDRLAQSIPFFPLVEFGLGMAVFGFVLARLRARVRRDGTALATASEARDHERTVSELRETDYDTVARPITRFIESGIGKEEYAQALLGGLPPEDARTPIIRAQVLAHREPPRPPPLEMEWAFAAGATMTLGLAIAAFALGSVMMKAPEPYPILLALLFIAFGTYAQQDVARSHHRPWLSAGIAAAGASVLLLDFLLFAGAVGTISAVPGIVWTIVACVTSLMIGIPTFAAWKQDQRLRTGDTVDARRVAPALEMQKELQTTRKRAATMALSAFFILLPMPWLAGWLAGRGFIPQDFPAFLDELLAVAIWILAAFGGAALVRFYGLTRGRVRSVAREKQKRDARLTLHRDLMQNIERT